MLFLGRNLSKAGRCERRSLFAADGGRNSRLNLRIFLNGSWAAASFFGWNGRGCSWATEKTAWSRRSIQVWASSKPAKANWTLGPGGRNRARDVHRPSWRGPEIVLVVAAGGGFAGREGMVGWDDGFGGLQEHWSASDGRDAIVAASSSPRSVRRSSSTTSATTPRRQTSSAETGSPVRASTSWRGTGQRPVQGAESRLPPASHLH